MLLLAKNVFCALYTSSTAAAAMSTHSVLFSRRSKLWNRTDEFAHCIIRFHFLMRLLIHFLVSIIIVNHPLKKQKKMIFFLKNDAQLTS